MANYNFVLTTKGIALYAKVQAGTTLNFTRCAIGDGTLGSGQSAAALTALINLKKYVTINQIIVSGEYATIRAVVTNEEVTSGFYMREFGIYATDPDDGEILFAVAEAGDESDYLPAYGDSNLVQITYDHAIVVGSTADVTVTIDTSLTYVTRQEFEEHTDSIASAENYGHAMASSATPLVAGTASAGTDNGKYAREGHVHPAQTSVSGNAGTASKLATARAITVSGDASGNVGFDGSGDVTLELDVNTADNATDHINDTSGAHAASAISSTATGNIASTNVQAAIAELEAEKAPKNHASSATTYGVPSASNYGHPKASSTTPAVAGTAAVGSEVTAFARGDHVHPAQTSVSGNAGTATQLATARTIALTGAVTGSGNFDGSGNLSIATTLEAGHSIAILTGTIANGGTIPLPDGYTTGYCMVSIRSTGIIGSELTDMSCYVTNRVVTLVKTHENGSNSAGMTANYMIIGVK
jgi:hypothetical protein